MAAAAITFIAEETTPHALLVTVGIARIGDIVLGWRANGGFAHLSWNEGDKLGRSFAMK